MLGNSIQECSIVRHQHEADPESQQVVFEDPDGVRLEITNFRQDRRERMERWDSLD